MEFTNGFNRKGEFFSVSVDQIKGTAIAPDFLFVTVTKIGVTKDDSTDTLIIICCTSAPFCVCFT